ncbi:MAG: ATP-binding protein [Bacteroidota bacterium]
MTVPLWGYGQTDMRAFHHLTVEDGLPSNEVNHCVQDEQGFLWFATHSGLSRYDGFRFVNKTVKDSLAKNDVSFLLEDSQDRIWILTRREITLYEHEQFLVKDQLPYLGGERALEVLEDSAGQIWLSNTRNLHIVSPDESVRQILGRNLGRRGFTPKLEFVDPKGRVWVSLGEEFLVFEGEQVVQRISLYGVVKPIPFPFESAYLHEQAIIYSGVKGLFQLDPTTGEEKLVFSAENAPFEWDGISHIWQGPEGDLWVSSTHFGVVRLHQAGDTYRLEDWLLKGIDVQYMMQDAEKNLWFCTTSQGVYLLSRNAAEIRQRKAELSRDIAYWPALFQLSISSLHQAGQSLWLGTFEGEIFELSTNRIRSLGRLPLRNGEGQRVEGLMSLASGELFAYAENKIYFREEQAWVPCYGIRKPSALQRTTNGQVLIGTREIEADYLLSKEDLISLRDSIAAVEQTLQWQGTAQGSFPRYTEFLREGPDQTIYALSSENLLRFAEGDFAQPLDTTEFRAQILDMAFPNDSTQVIATNGSGLIIRHPGSSYSLHQEEGLQSGVCYALYVDEQSEAIWIGTNRGLGKLTQYHQGRSGVSIKWFTEKDGLAANEILDIERFGKDLFLATPAGLTVFDESQMQADDFPPPVYITEVRANNEWLSLNRAPFRLSHDQNNLSIRFTGISFRNLGHLRFEYRLNDEPWKPAQGNTLALPALSDGPYTFTVRAVSRDGMLSLAPQSFDFSIAPIFYKSWWFIVLVVLVLLVMLFGVLRFVYTERERQLLEERVAEKTFELNQKVEELHLTNQDLQQFVYVASHDLKTPLRTVIGHLQLLARRYKGKLDGEADDFITYSVDGAKRMYEMINHLLNYAKLGRENIELEPIDLNVIVDRVLRSIHGLVQERKALIHFDQLPTFMGVPGQWETLFQNLIENGLKFNESEIPEIRIQYKDSPDFWVMSVADNGIGIDEEYQHKIFELFQRLHTTQYTGTGIGLAMVKRIVEVHGGSIWIESELGHGTTFFFTVKKQLDQQPQPARET